MKNTPNILTLSGWAQPYDSLDSLVQDAHHLDYGGLSPEATLQEIKAYNPDVAIGWSLGGSLLLMAKAHGLINPDWLVLLAAPLQFVADDSFPMGMGQQTFAQFYENMSRDPDRSSLKFNHLIAHGDVHHERIVAHLHAQQHKPDWSEWLPWLDVLAEQHHSTMPFSRLGNMLLIYGEEDVIVSHEQGKLLSKHAPRARFELLPYCAHAPHLHDISAVRRLIEHYTGISISRHDAA
jgi:pimeloyl-ACP methyl ester carboxylesterase